MSAINPDSFITPTSALSQPSPTGLGPGNVGPNRESPGSRRRQGGLPGQPMSSSYMGDLSEPTRAGTIGQNPDLRGLQSAPYPSLAMLPPNMRSPNYPQAMSQHPDPFNSYLGSPYATFDHMSGYSMSPLSNDRPERPDRSPPVDWTTSFQGLSLGS